MNPNLEPMEKDLQSISCDAKIFYDAAMDAQDYPLAATAILAEKCSTMLPMSILEQLSRIVFKRENDDLTALCVEFAGDLLFGGQP